MIYFLSKFLLSKKLKKIFIPKNDNKTGEIIHNKTIKKRTIWPPGYNILLGSSRI